MPSLQPLKLTVQPEQWDELSNQLNFLVKDIYSYLDELKGVDSRSATIYTGPTYADTPPTYEGLTASRLMATDANNEVVSTDLASWLEETANQITVTDDGDGTVTLSLPAAITLPGTLDLGGKLTAGVHEIEGSGFNIDGGDISAITISGSLTWSATQAITFTNTGLHILDTNASHDLIIAPGSDLSADRVLTITTGDAARTIILSGNPTLNDWFDQAVKQASSPTLAGLALTGDIEIDGALNHDGATVGFYNVVPVVQAGHIADSAGDDAAAVNAILVVLENLGFVAAV